MHNISANDTNSSSLEAAEEENSLLPDASIDKHIKIFIVSGRSGSGKTSTLNILEDFGYYAIDGMPLSLVPDAAAKLIHDSNITKVALGVDVRTPWSDLSNFKRMLDALIDTYGRAAVNVLYVTAQEPVLVARFDATRRVHPLIAHAGSSLSTLPKAIRREVELLEPIASRADIKIDTSQLNIHQLKDRIRELIGIDNKVIVNILSFGFKYGIPIDADFVFDVRILPNPHWSPKLRGLSGQDAQVADFFAEYPEVQAMEQDIFNFLQRWLPKFLDSNRHTVTIAIGCTGGKHRSVFITDRLQADLTASLPSGLEIAAKHRERSRWLA